jgi:hypothetical protein
MSHIIGIFAHLSQTCKEASCTPFRAHRRAGISSRIMSFLGPALRRHQLRNLSFVSKDWKLERLHIYHLVIFIERSRHNNINELLNVLSIVWSHAIANRTSQLIIEKVTSINPLEVLRAAVEHEIEVISMTVTSISKKNDATLTQKRSKS